MKYSRMTIVVPFLVIMFCGCFTITPPVRISGTLIEGVERRNLIKPLRERVESIGTIRGLLRASVTRNDERYRYRYAFAFKRPDNLRLDVLPLNSAYPLGIFVASTENQVLLEVPKKKAVKSRGYGNLLEQVTGLPLPGKDFPWLLLGLFPPTTDFELYRDDTGLILLSDNRRYMATYAGAPLRMQLLEIRDPFQEQLHAVIRYEYVDEKAEFPGKLIMTFPQHSAEGEIRYTSFDINVALAESLFEIDIPKDYKVSTK